MASKSTKKSSGSSGRKASVYSEEEIRKRERNGIIYIAVGVLFGVYIFIAGSGILGKVLSTFFFGLNGFFTYFLPFVCIGMGILTIVGKRGSSTGSFGWIVTGVLAAMTFAETTTKPDFSALQFTKYIANAYTAGATTRKGGGILGAIFCYPLQQLGGNALCYVATVTLMLLALLMLTRISIRDIGIRVNRGMHTAVERVREYEQEHERQRERERELEREAKPMRFFNIEPSTGETSGAESQQKRNTRKAVAEEPEEDTLEPLPAKRRKRAEKDDLAAFNAFAATLPVTEDASARKLGSTPSTAGSSAKSKELTYLSETELKPRPVRERAGASQTPIHGAAETVQATAYTPVRETEVPRDDTIWKDLIPTGDKLTDGTLLPRSEAGTAANTYHAAGTAAAGVAVTTAGASVATAGASAATAVVSAVAASARPAVKSVSTTLPAAAAASATVAPAGVRGRAASIPAEEPFYEPGDECPFNADESAAEDAVSTGDLSPEEALAALRNKKITATVRANTPAADASVKDATADSDGNETAEPEVIPEAPAYVAPPLELLDPPHTSFMTGRENPEETGNLLVQTLETFGISTRLVGWSVGPVITQYELQPAPGVRVSKITSLSNDIALALAAARVRIEAPIPGKSAVGIEVPNKTAITVVLRDIIESNEFMKASSPITLALGKDTGGKIVTADLGKMPHMLIAGSTGSGKSVCINDLILSMVYKSTPKDLRLILIDPKVVELSVYDALPHLLIPVVTEPKKASGALRWAVNEMTMRYKRFSELGARDLARYNALQEDETKKLYKLVVIVDELADLMMVAPDEVEDSICRIAQLGRAAGIHLIVATQRPSADIITGLIKANIPSRCAFAVSSGVDSRIILDTTGAEKLLGRGDMLFHPNGAAAATRVQAAFVSDEEVERVMAHFRAHKQEPVFDENIVNDLSSSASKGNNAGAEFGNGKQEDDLLGEAVRIVLESGQASISMIQRRLRVGYARAARLVDMMEQKGYVSGFEGSKARKVLIKREQFEAEFGEVSGSWPSDDEIKAAMAREEESI